MRTNSAFSALLITSALMVPVGASPAAAATDPCVDAGGTVAHLGAARVSCTFVRALDHVRSFTVPVDATSVDIVADGQRGESNNLHGGLGARVSIAGSDALAGQTLYLQVAVGGGAGGRQQVSFGTAFTVEGERGGGASAVWLDDAGTQRALLVAGGGGGGNSEDAGNAGSPGGPATNEGDGAGGQQGVAGTGGAGGAAGLIDLPNPYNPTGTCSTTQTNPEAGTSGDSHGTTAIAPGGDGGKAWRSQLIAQFAGGHAGHGGGAGYAGGGGGGGSDYCVWGDATGRQHYAAGSAGGGAGGSSYIDTGFFPPSTSPTILDQANAPATGTGLVVITYALPNTAPSATDDSFTIGQDSLFATTAPGVLRNDSDPDQDPLTATLVSTTSHGSLTLRTNGSFSYSPEAGFSGVDSFTYSAHDGSLSSTPATATINVTPNGPQPTDDAYATAEDTLLTVPAAGVLTNDVSPDGLSLVAALADGPDHGTLTLAADGSFVYTPNPNFIGGDEFTYTASDGSATSAPATVELTVTEVNDAPTGVLNAFSTAEDNDITWTVSELLANDKAGPTNESAQSLSLEALTCNSSDGSVQRTGDAFTYIPNQDFTGQGTCSYAIVDDGTTDGQPDPRSYTQIPITVSVHPVNDAPVAQNDTARTGLGEVLDLTQGDLLENDRPGPLTALDENTSAGRELMSVTSVSNPSHGTVSLQPDGTIRFIPAAGFSGAAGFDYLMSDNDTSPSPLTDSGAVTVVVNTPPTVTDDAYTTAEDTALTVPAPGLLDNDADVDLDNLTAVLVTGPAHGTLTLDASGAFSYAPAADYHGTDTFTYRAHDGDTTSTSATVQLTVTPVNDAPTAGDDSYSTAEDTALTVVGPGVLADDADVDLDNLTAVLVTGPAHGTLTLDASGAFSYTPAADYHGTDTFTYLAHDGTATSASATVQLTVTPVNDAPTAGDDSYTTAEDTALTVVAPGVLADDADVDLDNLTAVLVTGPAHGALTFNPSGAFSYTPDADYHGTDTFTYRAHDGTATSTIATVQLTVTPVNDAPTVVLSPGACGSDLSAEGQMLMTLTDVDSPLASLTVTFTSSNTTLLPVSGLAVSGTGGLRQLSVTGTPKKEGTAVITLTVSDGSAVNGSSSATARFVVGSSKNDVLTGIAGVDMLFGLAGSNTLRGMGGSDLLCGGNGNDLLEGGAGDDVLSGGRGNDRMFGGDGVDRLTGGSGADAFSGGPGTDTYVDLTPSQGDTQD